MTDLFDEPSTNSPDDLGGTVRPGEKVPKWNEQHPDHPAQRPENKLKPGEEPPTSWNVARVEMGIEQMRTFLTWCTEHDIDLDDMTVGRIYVALNAHGKGSFRWLCQQLKRLQLPVLPPLKCLAKAMSARDESLLYDTDDTT